jgi:hypothetical protein
MSLPPPASLLPRLCSPAGEDCSPYPSTWFSTHAPTAAVLVVQDQRCAPPPPIPCTGAPADCPLGRRQEVPISPPSPAWRLIVIWVVWPSYLSPPKAPAYCVLGGCVLLYSLTQRMIVIWVVVPSPPLSRHRCKLLFGCSILPPHCGVADPLGWYSC